MRLLVSKRQLRYIGVDIEHNCANVTADWVCAVWFFNTLFICNLCWDQCFFFLISSLRWFFGRAFHSLVVLLYEQIMRYGWSMILTSKSCSNKLLHSIRKRLVRLRLVKSLVPYVAVLQVQQQTLNVSRNRFLMFCRHFLHLVFLAFSGLFLALFNCHAQFNGANA